MKLISILSNIQRINYWQKKIYLSLHSKTSEMTKNFIFFTKSFSLYDHWVRPIEILMIANKNDDMSNVWWAIINIP
jgi:hypothetical protein